MWLEMSRDAVHGGPGWEFTQCLWSPTHKHPKGRWPYWEALTTVQKDDVGFHLRGEDDDAAFVGCSGADSIGYQVEEKPPYPGQWAYADSFYRVPLTGYTSFPDPVPLKSLFAEREQPLRAYFAQNKAQPRPSRKQLFYVIQNGKLQCQNGAYLSELDSDLASILFGPDFSSSANDKRPAAVSVRTGEQIGAARRRVGQREFSDQIRINYGSACCFPGCSIAEPALLVGAHIARWADAHDLRGHTGNGLCLCLFHDKAFELGLFTLTLDHCVAVNSQKCLQSAWAGIHVSPYVNQPIKVGPILPAEQALKQHWKRIRFDPTMP